MKKLISGALGFALLLAGGCDESEYASRDDRVDAKSKWIDCGHETDVRLIDVEGHRYLLAKAGWSRGGISVVHAESCPCREGRK